MSSFILASQQTNTDYLDIHSQRDNIARDNGSDDSMEEINEFEDSCSSDEELASIIDYDSSEEFEDDSEDDFNPSNELASQKVNIDDKMDDTSGIKAVKGQAQADKVLTSKKNFFAPKSSTRENQRLADNTDLGVGPRGRYTKQSRQTKERRAKKEKMRAKKLKKTSRITTFFTKHHEDSHEDSDDSCTPFAPDMDILSDVSSEASGSEYELPAHMEFGGRDSEAYKERQAIREQKKKEKENSELERVNEIRTCKNLLEKMKNWILPRDHGEKKFGRKNEWENRLQQKRANALLSFYNFLLEPGTARTTRTEAGKLASRSMGRAQGWGGRSIRQWARRFEFDQTLPTSKRGAHSKTYSLLNEPEIAAAMRQYLRTNKWAMSPKLLEEYSRGTMAKAAAEKYARHVVNNEMPKGLAKYIASDIFPRFGCRVRGGISSKTARRWMRKEGFAFSKYQKNVYIDGHERPDVVRYRNELFIPTMEKLQDRFVEPDPDNLHSLLTKENGPERPIIPVFHDESTFQANDTAQKVWVLDNQHKLRPKGVGRGRHHSEFISPVYGWYKEASAAINYGKNYDGYWCGDDVATQLKERAIPSIEKQHPGHQLLFIFDNSSGHASYDEDALLAHKMGLNEGGKQPLMRDGWYVKDGIHHIQKMTTEPKAFIRKETLTKEDKKNGKVAKEEVCFGPQPKGMRAVLMERGLWRHGLKHKCVKPKNDPRFEGHPCQGRNDCCATAILDAQSDFQEQECRIARIVKEAGHLCLFLPKYHCELNIIEFFWGITKRYVRENCSFKFEDLENRVYEGMALTSKLTMRKWYLRMWRWIKAYSEGKGANEAQQQVQRKDKDQARRDVERFRTTSYTSHRRVA